MWYVILFINSQKQMKLITGIRSQNSGLSIFCVSSVKRYSRVGIVAKRVLEGGFQGTKIVLILIWLLGP